MNGEKQLLMAKLIQDLLGPGRLSLLVAGLTQRARGPGFNTRSGHILWFLLLLIQEGQLSVTGENMCTKYWSAA